MTAHPAARPTWFHGHRRHPGLRHRAGQQGAGPRPPGSVRSIAAGVVAAGLLALLMAAVGSALAWGIVQGILSVVG